MFALIIYNFRQQITYQIKYLTPLFSKEPHRTIWLQFPNMLGGTVFLFPSVFFFFFFYFSVPNSCSFYVQISIASYSPYLQTQALDVHVCLRTLMGIMLSNELSTLDPPIHPSPCGPSGGRE